MSAVVMPVNGCPVFPFFHKGQHIWIMDVLVQLIGDTAGLFAALYDQVPRKPQIFFLLIGLHDRPRNDSYHIIFLPFKSVLQSNFPSPSRKQACTPHS